MNNTNTQEVDFFDMPNQAAIYDSLIKKRGNLLKSANDVALVNLGSPYYSQRLLEEYPNIKNVHIFVPAESMFIYMPFYNNNAINIQYVKDYKYTFKNCYTKFDCIFINPPCADYNFNSKLLSDSVKYLKDENSESILRLNDKALLTQKVTDVIFNDDWPYDSMWMQ